LGEHLEQDIGRRLMIFLDLRQRREPARMHRPVLSNAPDDLRSEIR